MRPFFFCIPDFLHHFLIGCVYFGCFAALWVVCLNSFCPCCSDCENTLWVRVHGSVVAALFVVFALGQPRQDCQRVALGCLVGLIFVSCAMDSRLRRTLSCSGVSAKRWQFCCCCSFSCSVFPSGIVRCRCRRWRQCAEDKEGGGWCVRTCVREGPAVLGRCALFAGLMRPFGAWRVLVCPSCRVWCQPALHDCGNGVLTAVFGLALAVPPSGATRAYASQ
ncbi:hypothetical protein Tc00.1047053511057.15 [Trypanosoma cruzi]|uniref:Uncharacterized protein n=1 Tax=Trypanosoma cruzi (strain CL Brener) TaxID=353153 RepID=Q4CZ93_TRYCC|nr:hypothetical protein Tc00.1047053511057.15 [Trypanosoma cruzi]EAN85596.1 hypothetical protein Tc00.1047053511057.15 [Trypanosoma cruzi]|eukprot:XP_807447.1 hypothetical protein [Trypanosoma cruzi strain CL Brener]